MKRLVLLLGVLCMGFQCEDWYPPLENTGEWRVKNATTQTVFIKPGWGTGPYELAPGDSNTIVSRVFPIWKIPDFDSMLTRWGDVPDEQVSFEVLAADGTPLVGWSLLADDSSGRRFFVESAWRHTASAGDREDEVEVEWLFEITGNDIP
jgi:hypothetical protein